jgi:hypothetical protein
MCVPYAMHPLQRVWDVGSERAREFLPGRHADTVRQANAQAYSLRRDRRGRPERTRMG